jgi:hypothetical protein
MGASFEYVCNMLRSSPGEMARGISGVDGFKVVMGCLFG